MAKGEYMAGMLRVLILSELSRGESYGYGIARSLEDRTDGELTVRPESLYPVLHRMEIEELVSCVWTRAENGRPRKVYCLTDTGKALRKSAVAEFIQQSQQCIAMLEQDGPLDGPAASRSKPSAAAKASAKPATPKAPRAPKAKAADAPAPEPSEATA